MAIRIERKANVPYPDKFTTLDDAHAYCKRLYDSIVAERSARIEDFGRITSEDLPSIYRASAYLGANQENITDSVATTVTLNTEDYDLNSNFDVSTYTYTVPKTGYYLICAQVAYLATSVVADKLYGLIVKKNGATNVTANYIHASVATGLRAYASIVASLTAADTLVLQAYHEAGVNTVDIAGAASGRTFMSIAKI